MFRSRLIRHVFLNIDWTLVSVQHSGTVGTVDASQLQRSRYDPELGLLYSMFGFLRSLGMFPAGSLVSFKLPEKKSIDQSATFNCP